MQGQLLSVNMYAQQLWCQSFHGDAAGFLFWHVDMSDMMQQKLLAILLWMTSQCGCENIQQIYEMTNHSMYLSTVSFDIPIVR